jgi:hypothetical protein
MDLQELRWGVTDWINLTQDRDRWKALVNALMNFRVENWVITLRVVVISCRRFGLTTYRSHLHRWTSEDGTDWLSRNVGKKLPLLAA